MSGEIRQLVTRCLTGDQQSIRELVERFRGPVFGFCYRMLGQRQDAEDVAQETFVRVLRNLQRWDPARRFEPWLLTIAGNRCRTALRRRMRRPAGGLVEERVICERQTQWQSAQLLSEEVARAMGQLRYEHREAFVLFHEQQLTYAEIAEVLECPVGTVRTWIHRARRELIEQLRQREVLEEARHAV